MVASSVETSRWTLCTSSSIAKYIAVWIYTGSTSVCWCLNYSISSSRVRIAISSIRRWIFASLSWVCLYLSSIWPWRFSIVAMRPRSASSYSLCGGWGGGVGGVGCGVWHVIINGGSVRRPLWGPIVYTRSAGQVKWSYELQSIIKAFSPVRLPGCKQRGIVVENKMGTWINSICRLHPQSILSW